MFDNLAYLYENGLISPAALQRAVGLGWITEAERLLLAGPAQ